jgi:hypothetical protein
MNLRTAVKMWHTPTVVTMEHPGRIVRKEGQQDCLSMQVNREQEFDGLPTGQLNPAWVEWLMGFPVGWTEVEPSATP